MKRVARQWKRGLFGIACAGLCALAACGGNGTSSAVDGSTGGMCSADVPAGQACNALATVVSIAPICVTGTTPTGQGGTIVDGTYVLTAETYYNYPGSTCPTFPVNETIQFAGDCFQGASSSPIPFTVSGTISAAGNNSSSTHETCFHIAVEGGTMSSPTQTFTATATTITFFAHEAAGSPNPDLVSFYTKE
jgi:hypothetical protein